MLRKIINSILLLPFALFVTSQKAILSETSNFIDEVIEEKEDKVFINYEDIDKMILENQELKSLKELVSSSEFNLASKISKKYPTLDLQANGFPKYTAGKNYNSNSVSTSTSQFSANPSLSIKWDLIDPLRDSEIKIARDSLKVVQNNFEIKRKDLIQEAKARLHKYKKSYQDIKNKKFALNLSKISLENAQSKLNTGVGTKFEVLEAEAQLSRDKQDLNEKKIEHKINKIGIKEILNIKNEFEIKSDQKLIGFWNYKLNKIINAGLEKNLSLDNISLQKEIIKNQGINFLNANKPTIFLSNTFSSVFTKGDSLSTSLDYDEYGSSYTNAISLNFSWKIFNGGQNKNSYKSKEAERKAENYSYANLKNVLKTNLKKAYLNLKLNEGKIISSSKEISSTKESLRLARLRYDVGISTLKDVLVRQKELSNAKTNNINAIYNYNLNLDELERLTSLEISNKCSDNHKINNNESICDIPI